MYGLIHKAIQDLICREHGEAVWRRIREQAGVEEEEFLSMEAYPDEMTYGLVAAASEVLGVPTPVVLEQFGENWVDLASRHGYSDLFAMFTGKNHNLVSFLSNLDILHSRLAMVMPQLRPPRFRCTDVTGQGLKLHYYSERPGLAPMTIGLLRGLGAKFQVPLRIQHVASKADGADHDEFQLEFA